MKARAKGPTVSVLVEVAPRTAKALIGTAAPRQLQRLNASVLPDQTEDIAAALRALLAAQSFGVRTVGLILGRETCTLRTLELPATDPKELASMLELQLGKLTPYPRAEILSAWTLVGSFREGYTSVLLAIARKTLVDDMLQVLKAKGLSTEWIGVSTEGLEAWWRASAASRKATAPGTVTALIDIDVASTDCAVLRDDRLLFTHSLTIGYEQLTTAEDAKLRWLGELVRLPRILAHEDIKGQIGQAVLVGLTQPLPGIAEQLASQWGVTVETADSLAPVSVSDSVRQSATAAHVSCTAAVGLLAIGTLPRIDLIPKETRVSQALHVRSKRLARLAGSLAALLVLSAILYVERILIARHYLNQLQSRLAAVEQTATEVQQRQRAMRQVREWLAPARGALEIVRSVANAVDQEIALTQLSLGPEQPLMLRGQANSMAAAFAFLDRLKQAGVFANVQARSVAKARGAEAEGAEFELVCELVRSP